MDMKTLPCSFNKTLALLICMWTTVLTHFVAAEGLNTGSSLSDPLLVGWGHKVLFPIRCEGDNILEDGQKLPMIWGPAVAKHVPGFGEGATVRLIIKDYSETV